MTTVLPSSDTGSQSNVREIPEQNDENLRQAREEEVKSSVKQSEASLSVIKGEFTKNGAESVEGGNQNEIGSGPQPSSNKPNRVPYVNLFKNNRIANEKQRLDYYAPGTNILKFTYEDMDSVETTFGICLLGCVLGGKPPTNALLDLVRRWGKGVHFQTHESGWIVFKFPNIEARERVFSGGSYMVYGYNLFLKEMPRCFCFREEDMNFLPSWVQVHGLPPDCWNHFILSNITSVLGKPIRMDLHTHDRERMRYARVLIEMNVAVQKLHELNIELPIGNVNVKFVYEQEIKHCHACNKAGHDETSCPKHNCSTCEAGTSRDPPHTTRSRPESVVWRQGRPRGRSRMLSKHRNSPSRSPLRETRTKSVKGVLVPNNSDEDVGVEVEQGKIEGAIAPKKIDKGNEVLENEFPQLGVPTKNDELDENGYTIVSNKKNKKKNKNKNKNKKNIGEMGQSDEKMATIFEGMRESNSGDTEYRMHGNGDEDRRFFGNIDKGWQPKFASDYQ